MYTAIARDPTSQHRILTPVPNPSKANHVFCNGCGKELAIPREPCPNCGTLNTPSGSHQLPPTKAPLEASHIGLVIDDKYEIESKLGSGGMATVYRATRRLIGDTVAIKILHPDQVRDPQSAERFRREAQAAARLKHPNAVTIYDFGVSADGLVYLVMELVEGRNIRNMIRDQGPLPPSLVGEILTQACGAIEAAHRQNIVHRDIKPDNIVVDATPSGLRVKVLDFGIAWMRDMAAAGLTQTGSVMGTPHYMSPEQCLGEELDNRSDIYSLGVVLFEMLAGVVPFNSPTSTAVIIQHVNQAPPPLRVINISVPAAIETVVLHALSKRREDRPQSAQILANEFNNALVGAGTAAERSQIAVPANEATTVSKGEGFAPTMQLSAAAWNSGPAQPLPPGYSPPPVSRSNGRGWMLFAGAAAVAVVAASSVFFFLKGRNAEALPPTQVPISTSVAAPATQVEPAAVIANPAPAAAINSEPVNTPAAPVGVRTLGTVCGESMASCPSRFTFEPYELRFQLPDSLIWQTNYFSAPFFAILLDSRKAVPGQGGSDTCAGFFTEAERLAIQAQFPDRKAFASRVGCRALAVDYTNFNHEYNFVGVYAGTSLQEARNLLRQIRATHRFPDANARLMKVAIYYGGE